jgi:hypothetical protein
MIEQDLAAAQIERLKALDKYPTWKDGTKDLIFALMAAETEKIALTIINDWIGYARECPKPAEIRKRVYEENEKQKPVERTPPFANYCGKCGGHGITGGHIGTKHDIPWEVCSCPLGRTQSARDRVDEGTVAREKLLRRFGPKTIPQMIDKLAKDAYMGDF